MVGYSDSSNQPRPILTPTDFSRACCFKAAVSQNRKFPWLSPAAAGLCMQLEICKQQRICPCQLNTAVLCYRFPLCVCVLQSRGGPRRRPSEGGANRPSLAKMKISEVADNICKRRGKSHVLVMSSFFAQLRCIRCQSKSDF